VKRSQWKKGQDPFCVLERKVCTRQLGGKVRGGNKKGWDKAVSKEDGVIGRKIGQKQAVRKRVGGKV